MAEGQGVPSNACKEPVSTPIEIDRLITIEDRNKLLANSPTATIWLHGVPVESVLDTGAETSLISSDFYYSQLAEKVGNLDQVGTFVRLMGANGLEIPVEGYLEVPIKVFGQEMSGSFLVSGCNSQTDRMRSNKYPVLLGCNVLRELASRLGRYEPTDISSELDLALRWFQSIEATCDQILEPQPSAMMARTLKCEVLPPHSAQLVTCSVGPVTSGPKATLFMLKPCLTDRCGMGRQPNDIGKWPVVEGVQTLQGSDVQVLVVNTSSECLPIPALEAIATISPVVVKDEPQLVEATLENVTIDIHQVVIDNHTDAEAPVINDSEDDPLEGKRESFRFQDDSVYFLPPGISLRDLPLEAAEAVASLIKKHEGAFSTGPFDLGFCSLIPHEINLSDDKPVSLPYRRVVPDRVVAVKQLLQDLLDRGIIRRSTSPYASPIVLVKKKTGKYRLCIDYRQVNAKTTKDSFPLPRIEETLESLEGAKWFTSLDLAHGYFQVALHPDSIAKTAFRVPWGLYEFLRLPQGLVNSPSTFQRIMESIFGDLNFSQLVLYLDDILVFSQTWEEHLDRLDTVFGRLEKNGLKLNGAKCKLLQQSVSHLGHVISGDGISVDPGKIDRILQWPTPSNMEQVRSFLGLASYYRRFVKGFSQIAGPLHALVGKAGSKVGNPPVQYMWTAEAENAFCVLKAALTKAPVLAYPRFDKDFVLEIDASLKGLGACLSQEGPDKKLHPVAYASRGLRGAEKKYPDLSSFKIELLALKWAVCEKFRDYLLGRHTIVWTDNNPLVHLLTARLGATEQRWAAQLAVFDLEIRYRSGRSNKCADALSRNPQNDAEMDVSTVVRSVLQCTPLPVIGNLGMSVSTGSVSEVSYIDDGASSVLPRYSITDLSCMQHEDQSLSAVWEHWVQNRNPIEDGGHNDKQIPGVAGWLKEWSKIRERQGVLYRVVFDPGIGEVYQLLVPAKLKAEILQLAHDDWGHQGVGRTIGLIKTRCFWPGFRKEIKKYIANCFSCVVAKAPTPNVRPPMQHLIAFQPLECLAIDFVKLDPGQGKCEDVLVMTDSFTKWAMAVPCRDQTSVRVAKALYDNWFVHYGIPTRIHSDQGRNFESKLVKEFCALYGVEKSRTTPYHPQGNGQAERFNKTLCGLIKSVALGERHKWPKLLPHLVFIYNTTPHSVTGYSPYSLMFGREPKIPLDHLFGSKSLSCDEDAIACQSKLLKKSYAIVRDRLERSAATNKKRYDKYAFAGPLPVGSRVLIKNCAFTSRHKLSNHYGVEQYIVMKSNEDKGLYAVCPATGGVEKWINRKRLILDPRGEIDLPLCQDFSQSPVGTSSLNSEDQDLDDSDDWIITCTQAPFSQSSVLNPNATPYVPEHAASSGVSDTGLRRSERLKKKVEGPV